MTGRRANRGTPRPKAQLSCLYCRQKKLKCDRRRPCNQCSKTNTETCSYAYSQRESHMEPGSSLTAAREIFPALLFYQDLTNTSTAALHAPLASHTITMALLNEVCNEEQSPWLAMAVHIPTFKGEVQTYLSDPNSASLAWIALFNAILSIGAQHAASERRSVRGLSDASEFSHAARIRTVLCLRASDYASPTAYTIEAMTLYLICEHRWAPLDDGLWRASIIIRIVVQLAMRLEYHHDPGRDKGMSAIEIQRRRRLWALLIHMDVTISTHCGMPHILDDATSEVLSPWPIHGDRLHSTTFPEPPAPSSREFNAVDYYAIKTAFVKIQAKANQTTFDPVARHRIELEMAAIPIPDWMDISNVVSRTDSVETFYIDRVLDVTLLINCARMQIHRSYFDHRGTSALDEISRQSCLRAAVAVLDAQFFFCGQGGRSLLKKHWRLVTVAGHSFVNAAMLLCLDVEYSLRLPQRTTAAEHDSTQAIQQLDLLTRTRDLWPTFVAEGVVAPFAFDLLDAVVESLNVLTKSKQRDAMRSEAFELEGQQPGHTSNTNNNGTERQLPLQVSPNPGVNSRFGHSYHSEPSRGQNGGQVFNQNFTAMLGSLGVEMDLEDWSLDWDTGVAMGYDLC